MNKKYTIGDYVIVSKIRVRDRQGNKVNWKILPLVENRLGQVVGLCTRYDGHIGSVYFNYEDPPYFVPKKTHIFWLVRFGLMNKAVEVHEGDMKLAPLEEIKELPTRFPKLTEKDKQYLSEDSKNWPRDKKGRWVSGPCIH